MKNTISKNSVDYDHLRENSNIVNNYFYDMIYDSFYCKDYYFYPFFDNFFYNNNSINDSH